MHFLNESMTKFLIILRKTNTPIKIRENGKLPDPILYWSSKQSASEFLKINGDALDEYKIVEISEIGDEEIAKMLSTTSERLTYREHTE
jgi:hypothetical protein